MKRLLPLLTALLPAPLTALHATEVYLATNGNLSLAPPSTYCNPLPIPDYPIGKLARSGNREQWRELADPSALWLEGKWYLYPSGDMAWVSADNGATWQHHPLNCRDVGYAPTVVKHGAKFLLVASASPLYEADSPLGPFKKLGEIRLPKKTGDFAVPELGDPMLFSDDDGKLFLYWGGSPAGGIWGVELDAQNPLNVIGKPVLAFKFNYQLHPWEAVGEWNQDPNRGWVEGAWMLKRNGTYYLTYSAAGTENRTYAMGCYVGKSPLGPFAPQKHNPILRTTYGLITGTAHGCIVAGPEDKLWAFYSILVGVAHNFERRIGMDRAEIDANGELLVAAATSLPQRLPGQTRSANSAETGWLPVNSATNQTHGSTSAPNLPGRFAVDNEMRTWWQPAEGDLRPTLTSGFCAPATVYAVRLIWHDVGLDTNRGVKPGPFRYRVELETDEDKWTTVLDRTASTEDLLVDYRECVPATGKRARLVITGWPQGITPSVAEFTIFGKTVVAENPRSVPR